MLLFFKIIQQLKTLRIIDVKKILLSIVALTLSLFFVTNVLAGPDGVRGSGGVGSYDFKWYQGAEGKDMAATVAPKSKKIAHSGDKAKASDKVADTTVNADTKDMTPTEAPKANKKKLSHDKAKSENK